MDNNLNDQTTENSEGEEKSPSSYTEPNAGYTEAEPQAKNDNSVPKEAADDNLKQEEIELVLQGDYFAIVDFLHQLNLNSRLVSIQDSNIFIQNNTINAKLTLQIYANN